MSSAMESFTLDVFEKIRINDFEVNAWHEFEINFDRLYVMINQAASMRPHPELCNDVWRPLREYSNVVIRNLFSLKWRI